MKQSGHRALKGHSDDVWNNLSSFHTCGIEVACLVSLDDGDFAMVSGVEKSRL